MGNLGFCLGGGFLGGSQRFVRRKATSLADIDRLLVINLTHLKMSDLSAKFAVGVYPREMEYHRVPQRAKVDVRGVGTRKLQAQRL